MKIIISASIVTKLHPFRLNYDLHKIVDNFLIKDGKI